MNPIRGLRILLLTLMLMPSWAAAFEIPDFTPNVVDPQHHLDAAGTQAVNEVLQRLRDEQQVWGAVLIVDTLGGEPIENVAVDAFEQWQLGAAGVDNGLLLVLAMNDRRSRFEVGYGLEGRITDLAARRALDDQLAPRMRGGDTAGAIIAAFEFLAQVVAQDPAAMAELERAAEASQGDDIDWNAGLVAWGVMMFALWLGPPLRNAWVGHRRSALLRQVPTLDLDRDGVDNSRARSWRMKSNLLVQGFLSINPGVFVVILSGLFAWVFYLSIGLVVMILALMILMPARKYASPKRYRQFLQKLAARRQKLIDKGHLRETSSGVYSYTPAYHASRRSSSSSRSGFSSSSGGGRSGGGGASSGW